MRFNVAQLLKEPTGARRDYSVSEEAGALDPELSLAGPLTGTVTLMRSSQGILVTGELRTRLHGVCRRCLEPCELDVELSLEEEFHPVVQIGTTPIDDVPEEERDEALIIGDGHSLDLSEVVRQGLWLTAASEALCRGDCLGLCPQCGGNRNLDECHCDEDPIDPRWAVLKTLIANEPESNERSN
jgi:uncharacterized protein